MAAYVVTGEWLTRGELSKRGWTGEQIARWLPPPTIAARKPGGRAGKLNSVADVLAVEAKPEWQEEKAARECRILDSDCIPHRLPSGEWGVLAFHPVIGEHRTVTAQSTGRQWPVEIVELIEPHEYDDAWVVCRALPLDPVAPPRPAVPRPTDDASAAEWRAYALYLESV